MAHVSVTLETPDELGRFNITDGNHGTRIVWPGEDSPYSNMKNLNSFQGEQAKQRLEVWTRYPENVPCTGSSVAVWRVPGEV